MQSLTVGTVAAMCGGTLIRGRPDAPIAEVTCDSRGTLREHSLFVAVVGTRFDGHDFLADAFAHGASAAIVSRETPDAPQGLALVKVADTVAALQHLATRWRLQFDIPVVGVTGSNGKTIVKDMLSSILAQQRTVHRSPGSFNSQIGVPLALLGLRPEHEVAIIEAGISRPGEMGRLAAMIQPTHGVLTHLGLAHAAGLPDLETTAREKLELFAGLDGGAGPPNLVYPRGFDQLEVDRLPGRPVSFGLADDGDARAAGGYTASEVCARASGYDFCVICPDDHRIGLQLNAPGRHNLRNATAAVACAVGLGASDEAIIEGIAAYEPIPMRLEMHTTPSGVTLINDAYSSDPSSAWAALGVLQHYGGGQRKIAILGDMLDLGDLSQKAHQALGASVPRTDVDILVCHGPLARGIGQAAIDAGYAAAQVYYTGDLDELHALLDGLLEPQDVVLLKASRAVALERAAERLLESVAPTRLRIDLEQIRQNYHALRRRLSGKAGFIAVVKSFGYGNDATRVSQLLAREGVDALAVAYADEGVPLRQRGLKLPILVTNALATEADKIVKHDLTPLVYARPTLDALAVQGRRFGKTVGVHLEVDTGMNRVGLRPEGALAFAREILARDELELRGVMTHFAAADAPDDDAFTAAQIERFEAVLGELRAAGIDPGLVHAANTAAAWRFPQAHYDAVRVGLGIYGLAPSAAVGAAAEGVRPALQFTTQVLHLKDVAAGESVGYNRTWVAERATRVATIAVGYNDGFPRFMSNGGQVLVGGMRCPVIGNVCMDVSMVDVTAVDDVVIGDEVIIFGKQGDQSLSVDEIARRGATINYEILCRISPRVRRIFVRE